MNSTVDLFDYCEKYIDKSQIYGDPSGPQPKIGDRFWSYWPERLARRIKARAGWYIARVVALEGDSHIAWRIPQFHDLMDGCMSISEFQKATTDYGTDFRNQPPKPAWAAHFEQYERSERRGRLEDAPV